MGILAYEIAIVTAITLLLAVVVGGAVFYVKEHDKRAEYYKRQAEICWRNK